MTKKYRFGYWFWAILSCLLVLGPLVGYVVYGFCTAEVEQKATLGLTVIASILLSVLSIVMKMHIRSIIFILILGIYICIDNVLPLIILICACTIIDEFIATPFKKFFHRKWTINKEIDKRLP